ncbi:MAG: TetR/AcrR family transcriptional regulator [Caulobacterales bacterium]|nr:TetR/AcrR family transcriptional regulator [Caulobacterales bacterium]
MPKPTARGRPRSEAARARVLTAARELLQEGGVPAVTVEAVAARSGVGKPTIYRSWPNAQAVAMAALMQDAPPQPVHAESAGPQEALRRQLRGVVATFASREGRSAAALIASADANTEIAKAFRHHVILKSRENGRAILERAVAAGGLRADLDMETALDLIYAPVFFRLLLGHQPLTDGFADAVVAHVLDGLTLS